MGSKPVSLPLSVGQQPCGMLRQPHKEDLSNVSLDKLDPFINVVDGTCMFVRVVLGAANLLGELQGKCRLLLDVNPHGFYHGAFAKIGFKLLDLDLYLVRKLVHAFHKSCWNFCT